MSMQQKNTALFLCDLAFFCLAALYAWLVMEGIAAISGQGAVMDSDLATYAQALAHSLHPENFASDPVLRASSPGVDINNLQSFIARFMTADGNVSLAMLRSGAIGIFIFYCGWYILGRWLFQRPALSALLAIACGVTVWIEYGTFWGVNHSDPVPRVYYAAIFPLLLLVALAATRKPALRPAALLLAGLSMWVHGVSALNCGAMFFMLFLVIRPRGISFSAHLANLALSFCAFILPVAIFLWPSFSGAKHFDAAELAVFAQLFDIRWKGDYSGSPGRLWHLLTSVNAWSVLGVAGLCAWFLAVWAGNRNEKIFARACPAFIIAILAVALFCFAESAWSAKFGRLAMGHELVRGIRFLVPLSITLLVIAGHILVPRLLVLPGACLGIVLILIFTLDRQYMAAQYAMGKWLGIELPLCERAERERAVAEKRRRLLEEIERIVPAGESIFDAEEDLAIRHFAMRPLAHAFKDGYIYYYNKDVEGARKWLALERLRRQKPDGLVDAWLASGAPWLLCKSGVDRGRLEEVGTIESELDGWLLVRRK